MKFFYKATSKDGKRASGIIEARGKDEVVSYLRSHGLLPITVIQKKESVILSLLPFFNKVTAQDVSFFTRQLASMLTSGLTLMEALRILKEQVDNRPAMEEMMQKLIADVEGGKSFSQSIGSFPKVFSPIYISLIKSAESGGLLDVVLVRLADNLEKKQKLKSTIKSALLYPAIVLVGMVVVMIVMMIFVVPQLSQIYKSFDIDLPLPTRIIVGLSDNFLILWPFFLGFGVVGSIIFRRWHKTEAGKLIFDDLLLRVPVFGKLIKQSTIAEFSRTLSLLVGAGTLVVEALHQTSDVAGNTLYKNAISGVAQAVEKGVGVGDALSGYTLFPPMLVQMAKIGEQTGKLDESLLRVSEYYEREVDQTTKTLATSMEPFIMVVLGGGVAFLMIAIITPIYSLTSAIK